MPVLPPNRLEQIQFCENHWPVWEADPTSIGVSAAAVTVFKGQTAAARTAYNDSQAARDASKSATAKFYSNTGTMRDTASDLIRQIKAYAESRPTAAERDAVYAAAQIDQPAPPTPMTAPGKPDQIAVNLEPSGAVTISWAAENAAASSGAFFSISRKLPGQSGYTLIGGSPGTTAQSRRMSYTDYTIPTSAAGAGAMYIIQGRRAALMGDMSEPFVVQFGFDQAGQAFVSAEAAPAGEVIRMAA